MENRLTIGRGRGVGTLGEKGEGIERYGLVVTEQLGGCKYSTRHRVNIVMTVCGARWVPEIPEGTLCKAYDCLPTMLYA